MFGTDSGASMEEFKTLLIFRGLLRVINELVMDVEKEGIKHRPSHIQRHLTDSVGSLIG